MIIFIVLAIAGNKFDLFNIEEVSEEEGNKFAEKIGAIFYNTSAKEGVGIEELFQHIGKIYLNPNFSKYEKQPTLKLEKKKTEKKNKSKCC